MAHYLYDVAKSFGFGVRNEAKALDDRSDSGVRAVVGGIQTVKAGTSIFAEVNKYDAAVKAANNAANYLSKSVNPLLCVASGARILASEDKPSTTIEEVCAMSAMFTGERLMKTQFKAGSELACSNFVQKGEQVLANVLQKTPILRNCKNTAVNGVITGLAFIIGSIGSYTAGHSMGKVIADNTTRKYNFIPQPSLQLS